MRLLFQKIALITALAAISCMAAGAGELSSTELKAGRKLYVTKCGRCHKLYDPNNYSDADWREWMDKMSKKSRLKPDQKELLSRYIDSIRASNTNCVRQ